jgi:hypothetical protein
MKRKISLQYGAFNHYLQLSRIICFDAAIAVARIFQQRRTRFDSHHMFGTAMQHAGTAATALLAATAIIKTPAERVLPLQHLQILTDSLKDMSHTYQPAERMVKVLEHATYGLDWKVGNFLGQAPPAAVRQSSDALNSPMMTSQRASRTSTSDHVDQEIRRSSVSASAFNVVFESRHSGISNTQSYPSEFETTIVPLNQTSLAGITSHKMTNSEHDQTVAATKAQDTSFIFPNEVMMLTPQSIGMDYLGMPDHSKNDSALIEGNTLSYESSTNLDGANRPQRRAASSCGSMVGEMTIEQEGSWNTLSPESHPNYWII